MAYDGVRSYLTGTLAAQNLIATASAQVITSTQNAIYIPISEPTTIVSIAGCVTAASSNLGSTMTYQLYQTGTTSIGSIAPVQTANAVGTTTLRPGIAVPGGTWLSFFIVGTGTASATETASAITFTIGVAPQFV